MEKWEKVEFYLLLATVLIGGIISLLDLFKILDLFTSVIPQIILLLLSLFAASLLVSGRNSREFMKSMLPTGTFQHFASSEEVHHYILYRIKQAKTSVWDTTWSDPLGGGMALDKRDRAEYYGIIKKRSKEGIIYRELMMFSGSEERVQKAQELIQQTGKGYQLKAIPNLPAGPPKRWNIVIIDKKEVILDTVAITQQDTVDYFCRYYDSQWDSAHPIKVGDKPEKDNLERLETFLNEHAYVTWQKTPKALSGNLTE